MFSNRGLSLGLLNYKWSQTGIYDIYDKSIVGVYVSLLFGAGASYWRSGDKLTAVVLAAVGRYPTGYGREEWFVFEAIEEVGSIH